MKEILSDDQLFEETDNKDALKSILFSYLIHWKWFVLSVVVCMAAAWVYLRYATPVYNVTATVMLNDGKKGSSRNNEMLALEDMGFLSASGSIENEMLILRSKSIIKKAIIEMKAYASYGTKGTIGKRDLYTESPIYLEMEPADLDKLSYGFAFQAVQQQDSIFMLSGTIGGKAIDGKVTLPAVLETSIGKITLRFRHEALPLHDETIYISVAPPIELAKGYLGSLNIAAAASGTSIANISFNTTNRQRGVDFVNQLIGVYNFEANNDKNLVATRTAKFIDDRITLINEELSGTESELENLKRNAGLTNISDAQTFVQENAEYDKKRVDIGTQLNLMEYLRDYINNPANSNTVIPSNVGVTDATLSSLINRYNELILERNRLLRTSQESNPVIQRKNGDIAAMQASIKSTLTSVYNGLKITRQDAERQAGKYAGRISSAPTQERALTSISRQQEIKAGLYLMLLQKREENSIALAATADNAKIIDDALPTGGVIAPNYSLIRMIAFVIGLLLPVGVITLINFFRMRIEGHSDVEKLTKLPILGDIPLDMSAQKDGLAIVVKENDNNLMSEVFRSLRTNLQFVLKQSERKVILITSTVPGEGKSFVSCNLAVSLALLGKRVVIVGLDIRKPRLADYFGIDTKSKEGITSFLVDDTRSLKDMLLPTSASSNLWVLPAGTIPPNPAELLARPSLDKAVDQLTAEFDYVILDTAPIGMVSDTLVAARVASATLYICRADYTYKNDFDAVNDMSRDEKLPGMSVVINAVDMRKKKYRYGYGYGKKYGYGNRYGYGYGYGKRYGYGYGYGEASDGKKSKK